MRHKDNYCSTCGTYLGFTDVSGVMRPVCDNCGKVIYYDPKVATATIVEVDHRVLMVRRATEVGFGLWSLPGGFVDMGELVESGAAREVYEETGLEVEISGLIGVFSEKDHPVVVIAFVGTILGGDLLPGNEVSELGFFGVNQLPPLAFPRDTQILRTWERVNWGQ